MRLPSGDILVDSEDILTLPGPPNPDIDMDVEWTL